MDQENVIPFHPSQDYDKLKDTLLSSGCLFEDEMFPADNCLLEDREWTSEIEWLRPSVIIFKIK